MSEPRVTILTATYNQERFVGPCIESVLAQSFPDWEMILFDDGSTDGTPERARSYKDARLLIMEHQHSGVWTLGARYNAALARARGGLLAILDGDDWWPVDKLRDQVRVFDDPDTVFSHGASRLYDEQGHVLAERPLPSCLRGSMEGRRFLEALLVRRQLPWSPTVMIRASAVRAIGGFFQPPYEPQVDYPTWLRLASAGAVVGMNDVVGCYRIRSSSVSRQMAERVAEAHERCVRDFLQAEGATLGLRPDEQAAFLRWSRAARDQDLARIRMKEGRTAAWGLFRRAFQDGPAWLKVRAVARLLQSVLGGTPRGPI